MTFYYVALQSKAHAYLLQNRFRSQGISSELTHVPREIIKDLCNMGIRFNEFDFVSAMNVIRSTGLPRCKVYREISTETGSRYQEIGI